VGYNVTAIEVVCNDPRDTVSAGGHEMSSSSVRAWCDACFKPQTGDVHALTHVSRTLANVDAIGLFDAIALVFASYIVAVSMVGEVKDTQLVGIAVDRAGDSLSPTMARAFTLLNGIRRWVFLPSLLVAVPTLVLLKGGACSSARSFLLVLSSRLSLTLLPWPTCHVRH
jgi:hypothetical protein